MILKKVVLSALCMVFLMYTGVAQAVEKKGSGIYKVPPYKIAKYIKKTAGERRAIVLYASWCPACVQKMPGIIDLENAKAGSIIAISIEENYADFARYIRRLGTVPFKAIVNDGSESKLAQKLRQFGVRPWNSIPQIILMDEKNKVVEQGNFSVEKIANFLFSNESGEP